MSLSTIKPLYPVILAAFFILILNACARADQAQDIADSCRFSTTVDIDHRRYVLEDNYRRYWDGMEDGELTVTLPADNTCQGVFVSLYAHDAALEVVDTDGNIISRSDGRYRAQWLPFDRPAAQFTIRRADPESRLCIALIHVMTPGDLPDWLQLWQDPPEDGTDMLVISTHPDDEILWFGGLIPYYAGELNKKVMVIYMVGGRNGVRVLELLDGLWSMGVRTYPDIGSLPDSGKNSIIGTRLVWGEETAVRRVTEAIRRYRPQVVVAQDTKGEYGHAHHIVTVEAVIEAVAEKAADPAYFPESADLYGAYQPHKLYIHLWKQGVISFDWKQPLNAFGGMTGIEVARRAFSMHRSQQTGKYSVLDRGPYNCSLFGLYWSDVGEDVLHEDMFENIP